MPQPYRKSRTGCKECKRRHIKCDETHPSCVNCSTSHRRCSLLSLHPHRPFPEFRPLPSLPSPLTPSLPAAQCYQPLPPGYGLQDLELLHHFENGMAECMVRLHESSKGVCRLSVERAFSRPYLMDQILAVSAAHLSTVRGSKKMSYQNRAMELQTRAVASFNAETASISTQNCVHVFLFSTFLGHQVLFETLSMRNDFSAFLDRFASCLRLHLGIRATTSRCWNAIKDELQPIVDMKNCSIAVKMTGEHISNRDEWYDVLGDLLDTANLNFSSIEPCRHAMECLRRAYDTSRIHPSRAARSVLAWCVAVSEDFIDLLTERRPEALVIFAYYAVLLHGVRDMWIIGDAGEFIIRSITAYLGSHWEKWLAWPNAVVGATMDDNVQRLVA
ncbi:hypothetical protein EDB80DRAFT_805353 [Ilyonectria destructans]|nr:hypothetical protein EDB80DRAFT_805353 [Ilyonectria destructans]